MLVHYEVGSENFIVADFSSINMQVYRSEFPLSNDVDVDSFKSVVSLWISNSPHSKLESNELARISDCLEGELSSDFEKVEWITVKLQSSSSFSIQYLKIDQGLEWFTTVTYHNNDESVWVGVQISCSTTEPGISIPEVKKPVIIREILKEFSGGVGSGIKVSSDPIWLEEDDIQFVAGCMNGEVVTVLPIVYVSANSRSSKYRHAVKPKLSAQDLAGLAHVFVEPDRDFSNKLMREVDFKNPYAGTVAVIWPETKKNIYVDSSVEGGDVLAAIRAKILEENLKSRPRLGCTWAFVSALNAHKKIQELKESESEELEDYIQYFDNEVSALKQQKQEAEDEVVELKNELLILRSMRSSTGEGVQIECGYSDAYPNEVKHIIYRALDNATGSFQDNSRAHDILTDIRSRKGTFSEVEQLRQKVKNIFKNFTSFDRNVRNGLHELGLVVKSDDGKHIKLEYIHDPKFTFSVAKTPSDNHAGGNNASLINRTLF